MIKLPVLALVVILAALISCDPTGGDTYSSPEFDAAVANCEQTIRAEAENPQSVSFGEILHDYVEVRPFPNSWEIYGEFTQAGGDRVLAPYFYWCVVGMGEISTLNIFTGHAADVDRTASRLICQRALAQRSEFPDRADFRRDGTDAAIGSLPFWRFSGTVDLMNSSGDMIPHSYYCSIDHGKINDLGLNEKE